MKEMGDTSGTKWLAGERSGLNDCLQAYEQLASSLAHSLVKTFAPPDNLAYGIRPCSQASR